MKKIIPIFFIAIMFATQSCGIYGKYKSETTSVDTILVPTYSEVFTDPQLRLLIALALQNNYDLKIAHEHVVQAEAQLLGTKLAYIPSVYAAPGASYQSAGSSQQLTFSFAQASWEIDIFGRLTNRKRIANALKAEMQDYEQAAKTELVAAVAQLYYTRDMLSNQMREIDLAIETRRKSVETMKALKEAGSSDEAAVSQFEASYYAARVQKIDVELAMVQTDNALRKLLCCDSVKLEFNSNAADVTNLGIESVNLQSLRHRPDVRAMERELEQSFYGVNLAKANCCPSITISGNAGMILSGGFVFEAVGSLLQPIFNSGRNIVEVRVSKSKYEESKYAYANALMNAGLEVNDAIAARGNYLRKVVEYDSEVKALQRALDATQTKMDLGLGTYLEVLIAQNALLESQMEQIMNIYNCRLATVNLYHAIGGGR
ncbi:MAG: TolC family protein [Paludibacteraceae bacterium]|nr:TolC family protein [Paludibacteraceae bacterium]